jgi:endoglycosylceramidase
MSLSGNFPSFHTAGNLPHIFDEYNRVRIFHGTNFVVKQFPWYPEGLLDESNLQLISSLGFNTVRLSLQWTGAEPEENNFNSTYFEITSQIIDNLVKYDIYPFLDAHQHVMSSYFCLYDGFPKWAVDKSRTPDKAFPWPLQPGANGNPCPYERSWSRNYFSDACGVAFQTLYDFDTDFQQSFWAFWQKSAEYFKDKPILGYEIINEPWAGDIYSNPELLLPGNAGSKNLLPFYDKISEAIRSKDASHLIFYEPVTWGMIFNGNYTGTGFDRVPGGSAYQNSSVLSFHYYCWWYQDSTDEFTRKTCDSLFGPKVFKQVLRDVKRTGGSVMLTEWGQGCDFDNADPYDETNECNAIMGIADQNFVSWTDWYFGGHMQEQNFEMSLNSLKTFARIYPKAIAGYPTEMLYNVSTKTFHLCFDQDTTQKKITSLETEIFIPFQYHFPEGIQVTIDTPNTLELVSIDEKKNEVLLRNKFSSGLSSSGPRDTSGCVTIAPAEAVTMKN